VIDITGEAQVFDGSGTSAMKKKALGLLSLPMLFILNGAGAADFNNGYIAHIGDLTGDGRTDIYVRYSNPIFIDAGPGIFIPIFVRGELDDFVLEQQFDGSFFIKANLTSSQLSAVSQWPGAPIDLDPRDFNFDGAVDLLLQDVADAVNSGQPIFDQLVFAPLTAQLPPMHIRAVDDEFRAYFGDLYDWYLNPNVFNEVETVNINQSSYIGVAFDVLGLSYVLSLCQAGDYDTCGYIVGHLSTILAAFGLNCIDWITAAGEDPDDFCLYGAHVWGSTIVMVPVRVFNEMAVEVAETAEQVSIGQAVLEDIADIFETVIGISIGGADLPPTNGDEDLDTPDGQRGYALHVVLVEFWRALRDNQDAADEEPRQADIVYITGRKTKFLDAFHLAIEHTPSSTNIWSALSAFQKQDKLHSLPNNPVEIMNITLGTVSSAGVLPPAHYSAMLSADLKYKDDCHYNAIPEIPGAGYNSNGYVHGLVKATEGTASIDFNGYVGGFKPVPEIHFSGAQCD
jgi:hypothetical protein